MEVISTMQGHLKPERSHLRFTTQAGYYTRKNTDAPESEPTLRTLHRIRCLI